MLPTNLLITNSKSGSYSTYSKVIITLESKRPFLQGSSELK